MLTSNKQRFIAQVFAGTLAALMLITFGGLIWQAQIIAGLSAPAERLVAFGPLTLIRLTKMPIDGGFTANFEFLPGLIWFFIGGMSLSLLVSGAIIRLNGAKAISKP